MIHAIQSSRVGRIALLVFFSTVIFYTFWSLHAVHELNIEPFSFTHVAPNDAALKNVTGTAVVGEDVTSEGIEPEKVLSTLPTSTVQSTEVNILLPSSTSNLEKVDAPLSTSTSQSEEANAPLPISTLQPEISNAASSSIPQSEEVNIPLTTSISQSEKPNVSPTSISQSKEVHTTPPTSTQHSEVPVDYFADKMIDKCESMYGLSYLENLAATKMPYCEHDFSTATAEIECFRTTISDPRTDSFCMVRGAIYNPESNRFDVDCHLKDWWNANLRVLNIPPISHFPTYMYETGPAYAISEHMNITQIQPTPVENQDCLGTDGRMAVLVKREGAGNPWHCLNEIFSFFMSMDVLWMSSGDNSNGLVPGIDYRKAQVVITDHEGEGAFWDLWGLFSGKPPIRLADFQSSIQAGCPQDILLPLPGGSNPLWHDDWLPQSCTDSQLLNTFTYRLRNYYNVSLPTNSSRPITMTIIDRKASRRIANFDYYVNLVHEGYPNVDVRVVDFAAYTFAEQVSLASETDILVGVHGAGLVHAMFMPKNGAVVEILPKDVDYRVYRNLAKLRGHRYFGTHAIEDQPRGDSDWHEQDIMIKEQDWVDLIEGAVRSMENRGTLNMDIT